MSGATSPIEVALSPKRSRSPDFPGAEMPSAPKAHKAAIPVFQLMPETGSFHPLGLHTPRKTTPRPFRAAPPKFAYFAKIGGVPCMPRGGYKDPSTITDPFNRNALEVERTKSFRWNDQTIPFDTTYDAVGKCRTFVGGAHCLLSRIPETIQAPLIPGMDNQMLIMKTFLSQSILSKDENISVSDGSANHVIAQYRQLQACGVPVATLANEVEASQGCGFFLFEYVPHAFTKEWSSDARIETDAQLAAIYHLFEIAAANQLDIDLRPTNLRHRNDGTLVVVDILESQPKKGKELYFELENRIKTFCEHEGDPIYNQLIQAISCLK
jgi:hypothetical protein